VTFPLKHADGPIVIGVVVLGQEGEFGVMNESRDDNREVIVVLSNRIRSLQLQEFLPDSRGDREVHGLD
jgi:hypothetical protein